MGSGEKIGLLADIHGDLASFLRALNIFRREGVSRILCAGDVADRGPEADAVVRWLKKDDILCVCGNHDASVGRHQDYWRRQADPEWLASVGRIVSDETARFLCDLPFTTKLTVEDVPILMAHASPWDKMLRIYPNSAQRLFDALVQNYGYDADVIVLGHTHQPMNVRIAGMWVLNPGSVYGASPRDSHTCATLTVPDCEFRVFSLADGFPVDVPVIWR